MPTARGIFRTRLKSSTVSVMPMPSMMTASPHVMNSPLNQVNQAGCTNASAPPSSTQAGKRFVVKERMRFMCAGIKRKILREAIFQLPHRERRRVHRRFRAGRKARKEKTSLPLDMQLNGCIMCFVMDAVFKALADESRRKLLDQLHQSNGQTLGELCAHLDMTRQAVTKHLL